MSSIYRINVCRLIKRRNESRHIIQYLFKTRKRDRQTILKERRENELKSPTKTSEVLDTELAGMESGIIPKPNDVPPNIPYHRAVDYKPKDEIEAWTYFPKPLQPAHEFYVEDDTSLATKPDELLTPEDRFRLYINRLFRRVREARCGEDLVDVLREQWERPDISLTSNVEALRRTLDIIVRLNEIKQFAFRNSDGLTDLFGEICEYAEKEILIYSPAQIADLAWCMAQVGARPPKFTEMIRGYVERKMPEMTMAQLGDVFYAFQELRVESKPLEKLIENCIVSGAPRTTEELSPEQLLQLSFALAIAFTPTNTYRRAFYRLMIQIGRMAAKKPYLSPQSLVQFCRFSTAYSLFFPTKKFCGAIPHNLREQSLYAFKSGRVEMYSPPFLDPMMRQLVKTHYGVMHGDQEVECMGLKGWWLWSVNRGELNMNYSVEPGSRSWYTRLDDTHRLLGQHMLRHKIIRENKLHVLFFPYYDWELLLAPQARIQYFTDQAKRQLDIRSYRTHEVTMLHLMHYNIHGRLQAFDDDADPDKEIAWTYDDLCRINADQDCHPTRVTNHTFAAPHAYYAQDSPDRRRAMDFWSKKSV
eukprot:159435_1